MDVPGSPVARYPSLSVGSPPWRAARSAATMGAMLEASLDPDSALDALSTLGLPEHDWLDVLRAVRRGGACYLRLPRPGDARGLALPRGVVAGAAVGWPTPDGQSEWLIPTDGREWLSFTLPRHAGPVDLRQADQDLRREVVRAAHVMDLIGSQVPARADRDQLEGVADSWVLGRPPLPIGRRALAATALRLLLALALADPLPADMDSATLERAARSAVESAFSFPSRGG